MKRNIFRNIMIATDGSECSKKVVDKGIEFARFSGGTVCAVYVVSTAYISAMDGSYSSSIDMFPYFEAMHDALKKQGQQAIDYVKELGAKKSVNVESVLLEGNPSEELIRYAEKEKMDIVIMGTIGKTGLDRMLLGSVAGNVVRHSKVPVMVVREKCES
jgi:nucleotide-binding universal stress UspA family protein